MKPITLTETELRAINGGADQCFTSSAFANVGAGSLLSVGFSWNDGKGHSYAWQLDIGKDIHAGVGTGAGNIQ